MGESAARESDFVPKWAPEIKSISTHSLKVESSPREKRLLIPNNKAITMQIQQENLSDSYFNACIKQATISKNFELL
jgi:hypothetical protein